MSYPCCLIPQCCFLKKAFLCFFVMACGISANAHAESFEIGLIGDLPYHEPPASWRALWQDLDRAPLDFVVHVGDIKAGNQPCSDVYFQDIQKDFQASKHPLFYTPGDNEWTDCIRHNNGHYNPHERLTKLRELFAQDDHSFGQTSLAVQRQGQDYPENLLWQHRGVTFAALHIVGSHNNLMRQNEDDDALWAARQREYQARQVANLIWLKQAFDYAKQHQSPGLMLFIHANPLFEMRQAKPDNGFRDFLRALEDATLAFAQPVVLVHGDSHYFRVDKPLRHRQTNQLIANFTRVEVFGDRDVHWVWVRVDSSQPQLFFVQPEMVKANRQH